MNEKKEAKKLFCEINAKQNFKESRIIKFKKNKWIGIENIPYKNNQGTWALIQRFPLFKSEFASFEVRYFEIAPGGCSSLEYHNHIHFVICIRGKGKIKLGKKQRVLDYLDVAYIAPNEIHQLLNPYNEPFGFLCIVDVNRDEPIELRD